ncbi:MAG: TetR family transcriptional regulator [Pseudomonadales bacterium]
MGRRSTLREPAIFSAVAKALADAGTVTLADIVEATGVAMGSLYHRYGSREGLLAAAWLDALQAFVATMAPLLRSTAPDAGVTAATGTTRFCRAEPERAIILACCRQSEFFTANSDPAITAKIEALNESIAGALVQFAKQQNLSLQAARLGLVSFPLGAVRQFLPRQSIPEEIDTYVAAAYKATVANYRSTAQPA